MTARAIRGGASALSLTRSDSESDSERGIIESARDDAARVAAAAEPESPPAERRRRRPAARRGLSGGTQT